MSSEASVRRLDLLPEDKAVIIASDGLWDVIGDQDVVTMVDQLIQVCKSVWQAVCIGDISWQCALQTFLGLAYVTAMEVATCFLLPLWSLQEGLLEPASNATAEPPSSILRAVITYIMQLGFITSCLHLFVLWPWPQSHACATWSQAQQCIGDQIYVVDFDKVLQPNLKLKWWGASLPARC